MTTDYGEFLARKSQQYTDSGFAPTFLPDSLFDFQRDLVEWAVQKGRAAVFADTGLGKTLMQVVWAQNVVEQTNKPVLILAPLMVATQTVREAEKFSLPPLHHSRDGQIAAGINITNYEKLHFFTASDFGGVVCDESGILKSFNGVRRDAVVEFMRSRPYRLLCSATPAPNDYTELGNSSEALGYLGHMDMLTRFFKNTQNTIDTRGRFHGFGAPRLFEGQQWRFRGHAEQPFWRWVTSWARAIRKPSDMGYEDTRFNLPPLEEQEHMVSARQLRDGQLFALPAVGLREQREERKRTIQERCEYAAQIVETAQPALVWCHLNEEGDLLEKLIPDAIQISGKDTDEAKERKFLSYLDGSARVLVTKPKIGAWGLNLQHCAHEVMFPSHSFEQYYQSIRRCWRFGQMQPVHVDIIATEGERGVLANLQRKQRAAERMFDFLVAFMNDALGIESRVDFAVPEHVPSWFAQNKGTRV